MGKSWMPCRWPAAGGNVVAGVCGSVVEEENELELSTSADQPVLPGSLVAALATTNGPRVQIVGCPAPGGLVVASAATAAPAPPGCWSDVVRSSTSSSSPPVSRKLDTGLS